MKYEDEPSTFDNLRKDCIEHFTIESLKRQAKEEDERLKRKIMEFDCLYRVVLMQYHIEKEYARFLQGRRFF